MLGMERVPLAAKVCNEDITDLVLVMLKGSFFLQDCHVVTAAADWHHNFTIPSLESFSGSVQRAVETGVISSKARREIVQVLRTMMIAHTVYPTSDQYVSVSQRLIAKFPKLKDPIGTNGFVSDTGSVIYNRL